MLISERITTNAKEIAPHFCTFFSNIPSSLKTAAAPLKDFIWSKPRKWHPNNYSTFHFRDVRVNEVFKYLKKLSRRKACEPNDLPPGMLKDCALEIAKPLCHVINISIKKDSLQKISNSELLIQSSNQILNKSLIIIDQLLSYQCVTRFLKSAFTIN